LAVGVLDDGAVERHLAILRGLAHSTAGMR
jgi:hypothetical protein